MKKEETFLFGQKEEVIDSRNLIWFYLSKEHDKLILEAKSEGKLEELLKLRVDAFFDFINGILQLGISNTILTRCLNNYFKNDLHNKLKELKVELLISYDSYSIANIQDENSKNQVIIRLENVYKLVETKTRDLTQSLIEVSTKNLKLHWNKISTIILSIRLKLVSDIANLGSDFEKFRKDILHNYNNTPTTEHLLLDLNNQNANFTAKTNTIFITADWLWDLIKFRIDYLRLYQVLLTQARNFENVPDYSIVVNCLKNFVDYGNRSDFMEIKNLVDFYNEAESEDGIKVFYFDRSNYINIIKAKSDLLQFIYNPKICIEPLFVLDGPTDRYHGFVYYFFTDPVINKASGDKFILNAIDHYKAFCNRQRNLITKAAVTRHMQRMRD